MKFEYPEDEKFFADLLTNGDITKLHTQYTHLFDFNHPAIKRWEFNKVSKKLLKELMEKYEGKCQLCIHPDCSKESKFECDHIIPLSTNELNKTLRNMKRVSKEKVSAQSFGSNHIDNLILACKRCNAFKKHKILPHKFHS